MYRLAEMTRDAEPDDAAKLLMAVRKAREQLIIEQMKEVLDLLGRTELNKAVDEQKQVLIKLEELKKLLLSTNLDLQMQLERLRKIQEALAKLEGVVKEEQRQQGESGKLAEQEKKGTPLEQQAARRAQAGPGAQPPGDRLDRPDDQGARPGRRQGRRVPRRGVEVDVQRRGQPRREEARRRRAEAEGGGRGAEEGEGGARAASGRSCWRRSPSRCAGR